MGGQVFTSSGHAAVTPALPSRASRASRASALRTPCLAMGTHFLPLSLWVDFGRHVCFNSSRDTSAVFLYTAHDVVNKSFIKLSSDCLHPRELLFSAGMPTYAGSKKKLTVH